AYLGQLLHVYEALEDVAIGFKGHATMGPFYTPELFRYEAIAKDLAWYTDATIEPMSSATAYADRIRTAPMHAFVAHHWLRYLGYVLGQDILNKLVTKAYGPEAARAFYAFPDIPDPKAYLGGYHAKMNGLDLTDAQRAEVVDEGNRAFALQIGLTEELARAFGIGEATETETDALLDDLKAQHP
ncbi:MAG: biliverdin-producing heme oxygenase, partial [Actinobacteria bacterium]|nr:biliverdin-producing heme oxygenase [Actinomycetota bacterium]